MSDECLHEDQQNDGCINLSFRNTIFDLSKIVLSKVCGGGDDVGALNDDDAEYD